MCCILVCFSAQTWRGTKTLTLLWTILNMLWLPVPLNCHNFKSSTSNGFIHCVGGDHYAGCSTCSQSCFEAITSYWKSYCTYHFYLSIVVRKGKRIISACVLMVRQTMVGVFQDLGVGGNRPLKTGKINDMCTENVFAKCILYVKHQKKWHTCNLPPYSRLHCFFSLFFYQLQINSLIGIIFTQLSLMSSRPQCQDINSPAMWRGA